MYKNNPYSFPYQQVYYPSNNPYNQYMGQPSFNYQPMYSNINSVPYYPQMNANGFNNAIMPPNMPRKSLGSFFKNFKYSTFLDSTQKTLGTINQLLPIYNQVSPILKNASVMFRVANAMNSMPPVQSTNDIQSSVSTPEINQPLALENKIENPKFF